MTQFQPSTIQISSKILLLLELIAKKQGELHVLRKSVQSEEQFEWIAAVDAIHYSTRIEGNTLSRDQVTQVLEKGRPLKAGKRDIQEVFNYSRARKWIRKSILEHKKVNEKVILQTHSQLLDGIVKGKLKGHYREAQCVIQDARSKEVVYMAADWKDVPHLMKGLLDWVKKQRQDSFSPLLLAGQFHFELVTIHPFMDGNGRISRMMTNAILLENGYEVEYYAALEKQHEKDRQAYYRNLRRHQAHNYYDIPEGQNIQRWIEYWLECLDATYDEALKRIHQVTKIHDPSQVEDLDLNPRLQKAVSLMRRHRKMRAGEYAEIMGLGRTQAIADLNQLSSQGVIEKIGGGRSTLYRLRKTS